MSNDIWSENESKFFLRYGAALIPKYIEVKKIFSILIDINFDNTNILAVDICCGGGWLTELLLSKKISKVEALDYSEEMLNHVRARFDSDSLAIKKFNIHDLNFWNDEYKKIDLLTSSLALHHLRNEDKYTFYKNVYEIMSNTGMFIALDIFLPMDSQQQKNFSKEWEEETKKQSISMFNTSEAYEFFINEEWNYYNKMEDPIDFPIHIKEQINMMEKIGYKDVFSIYIKGGHYIFGGKKY